MVQSSSLRRDIISAYLASGAKIASWVIVSAIVFRKGGIAEFGMLALIRATIGLLQYASLGLGPAMVRMLAQATQQGQEPQQQQQTGPMPVLSYTTIEREPVRALYSTGFTFAVIASAIGLALLIPYTYWFHFSIEGGITSATMGIGLLLRLMSEAPGAVIQTHGRISRDNRFVLEAEIAWAVLTAGFVLWGEGIPSAAAGTCFMVASAVLLLRRKGEARAIAGRPHWRMDRPIVRQMLGLGALVTLAQLADYLYAPTDYILINHFWHDASQVAIYAPAVQIDAGLLLLVSGLAAVLFPRSAIAHAAGDVAVVKRYYIRGTLASAGILAAGAAAVWALSPFLFRLWLGNPMDATRAILPLVLIHTVIGGSAMVGRSVLLAAGKFRDFAMSVLLAGLINVVFSYVFVRYFQLGLAGIVYGTIIATVTRCVLWMPWYVMRSLREVREVPAEILETPMV